VGEIERCQLELSPQDFFFSDRLDGSDSVVGVRYSVSLFVDIIFLSGNATQRRVFDRALGGVVAVLAGSCKIACRLLCGGLEPQLLYEGAKLRPLLYYTKL